MKKITLFILCPAFIIMCGCTKTQQPITPEQKDPVLVINDPDLTVNIGPKGGLSSFTYSIENPTDDGRIEATSVSEWITSIDYNTSGVIIFEAAPNPTEESRTCEIAVTYTYGQDETVEERMKIVQSPNVETGNDYEFEAQVFYGIYYGMRHGKNREYSFYTRLSNLPELSQAGSISYEFEMFTTAPEDDNNPLPAEGTYFLGNEGETEISTFTAKYTEMDGNGNVSKELSFTSGTLVFAKEGDTYSYELTLTDNEGLTHHVTYSSKVSVAYEDMSQTTLTLEKDLDIEPVKTEAYFQEIAGEDVMHVRLVMYEDEYLNNHSEVYIEAYMPFDPDGQIAEGTYDITENYSEAFTIENGEIATFAGVQYPVGTYVQYIFSGAQVSWGAIKSGTMTVAGSNGDYDIVCNFVTVENFNVVCNFSGKIEIQEMPVTTLTGDIEVDLSKARGEATFYGDANGNGSEWMIELLTDNGGDCVRLEINCGETEFSDGITSGTYTASPSSTPWTGEYRKGHMTDGGIAGTIYVSGIDSEGYPQEYAPAIDGNLEIEHNYDGTYDISFAFEDDLGNIWSGHWNGELECTDTTLPPTSTLTGDYDLDLSMTGTAKAYFEGDYGNGYGNWVIQLKPSLYAATDGIQIDILCESIEFADGIPTGTFTVAENGAAGNLNPGEIIDGGLYGTMFLGYDIVTGTLEEYAAAKSGSAEITDNGDGTHTLEFEFTDENGYNFKGQWSGRLELTDYSD